MIASYNRAQEWASVAINLIRRPAVPAPGRRSRVGAKTWSCSRRAGGRVVLDWLPAGQWQVVQQVRGFG